MRNIVPCPSCERPLQIPEELHGRPLRCPACGQVFMLPPTQPSTPDAAKRAELPTDKPVAPEEEVLEAEIVDEENGEHPPGEKLDEAQIEEAVRQRIFGPAVGLVIMGTVGLFVSLYVVAHCLRGEPPNPAEADWLPEESKQMLRQFATGTFYLVWSSILAAMNFVTLLAARQMFYLRYWWFGVLGSILAIINGVFDCYCLLGIVIGVHALVVLYDPTVRRTFE